MAASAEQVCELVRERRIPTVGTRQPMRPVADPSRVEVRRGGASIILAAIRDGEGFRSFHASDQEPSGVGRPGRKHGSDLGNGRRDASLRVGSRRVDSTQPGRKPQTNQPHLPEGDPAFFQNRGRATDLPQGAGLSPRRPASEQNSCAEPERKATKPPRIDFRVGQYALLCAGEPRILPPSELGRRVPIRRGREGGRCGHGQHRYSDAAGTCHVFPMVDFGSQPPRFKLGRPGPRRPAGT